jgi:hypothetical protein
MLLPFPDVAPEAPVWETVQVNVVPVTLLVNAMEAVPPEQMERAAGVAVTLGIGFTVITTFTGVPEQPFTEGVTVYVAVPGEDPDVFKIWEILLPLPAVAPVTPDWATIQAYVVPETLPVKAMDVAEPEQMV